MGNYGLIGGADGGDLSGTDDLGQAGFSVTVESANVAPEPVTSGLLGTALLLVAWLNRRRGRVAGNISIEVGK